MESVIKCLKHWSFWELSIQFDFKIFKECNLYENFENSEFI